MLPLPFFQCLVLLSFTLVGGAAFLPPPWRGVVSPISPCGWCCLAPLVGGARSLLPLGRAVEARREEKGCWVPFLSFGCGAAVLTFLLWAGAAMGPRPLDLSFRSVFLFSFLSCVLFFHVSLFDFIVLVICLQVSFFFVCVLVVVRSLCRFVYLFPFSFLFSFFSLRFFAFFMCSLCWLPRERQREGAGGNTCDAFTQKVAFRDHPRSAHQRSGR